MTVQGQKFERDPEVLLTNRDQDIHYGVIYLQETIEVCNFAFCLEILSLSLFLSRSIELFKIFISKWFLLKLFKKRKRKSSAENRFQIKHTMHSYICFIIWK